MPTSPTLRSEAAHQLDQPRVSGFGSASIRELITLAVRGLTAMFDAKQQLFCHRLAHTQDGLERQGLSPRYTAMTLLGLKELEAAGEQHPFDLRSSYASLIGDRSWIQGVGDLGLLIWVTAALEPDRVEDLLRIFDFKTALNRYRDARESHTMELAWFLAGLAHAAEACEELIDSLTDLCVEIFLRLQENQGKHGLFGHLGKQSSVAGWLRGWVGSFADQVYPIYAMSKIAAILNMEEALQSATACATAICEAQGKLGQWWWLYDAHRGHVASHYPVYSVHQHGMAPMALFAVEEASGRSFGEFIHKGLHWIYGPNEVGLDMRDSAQNLIWRCLLPRNPMTKYWEMALSAIAFRVEKAPIAGLRVLFEQRPYEFGWLLFAFAKRSAA
jgi:hypothetical protein